jgi:hypothetical protein
VDYDDLWEPEKSAIQLELLHAGDRPEIEFEGVGGGGEETGAGGTARRRAAAF